MRTIFLPGAPVPFGGESPRLPYDSRLTFRPSHIIVMNFQTGNRPMVYFDAVERLNPIGLPKELEGSGLPAPGPGWLSFSEEVGFGMSGLLSSRRCALFSLVMFNAMAKLVFTISRCNVVFLAI
jgi:hypothetical protein